MRWGEIPADVLAGFREGAVIPAHPLALDAERKLDERRQRALTRYYLDAGSGGLAVGVHTTQFAIRDVGLYRPVLELAVETARAWTERPLFLVAGVAGRTESAVAEARSARGLGYHAVLVSLAAFRGASEDAMIAHCEALAAELPVVGFYLQPAVGGVLLSRAFWTRFAAIENVIGIKVAPFDRYRTLDVVHGVAAAGAQERISLYTGNDDHIVLDLTVPFRTEAGELRFAAFFDVANAFHGVIAGCHEVLRRQGLLEGRWCLDPAEDLSPGQAAEIDRVYRLYPELSDDAFVAENLERWLEAP